MKTNLKFLAIFAATAILLPGCSKEDVQPDSLTKSIAQNKFEGQGVLLPEEEVKLETPIASIEPADGTRLDFYAWDDGSAGVLESISGKDFSLLQNLEMADATPAEIFWAFSKSGVTIPASLLTHHEAIKTEESRKSISEIQKKQDQGWALKINFRSSGSPCDNSVFFANHCLPKEGYTHGKWYLDTNLNITWDVTPTRRYKAGFCLSQGTVNDYLYYVNQTNDCLYERMARYIWGNPFPDASNSQWHAVTYLTWTWWAGSNSLSRKWVHKSFNSHSGDQYDWACIYKFGSICD